MAGGIQQDGSDDEITGINVTPLVDIVLVLLIIFMVATRFITPNEAMEVELPRAANGGESLPGLVNVVLDKQGKLYFDGAEVSEPQLVGKVKESVGKDPQTHAIISADQAVDYGRVMRLIDVVKGQGISKFALNIQRDAAPAPIPAPQ